MNAYNVNPARLPKNQATSYLRKGRIRLCIEVFVVLFFPIDWFLWSRFEISWLPWLCPVVTVLALVCYLWLAICLIIKPNRMLRLVEIITFVVLGYISLVVMDRAEPFGRDLRFARIEKRLNVVVPRIAGFVSEAEGPNEEQFFDIPAELKNDAHLIHARKLPDGSVWIEFVTGDTFLLKRVGFLYVSPDTEMIRADYLRFQPNNSRLRRIKENWYDIQDWKAIEHHV